MDVRSLCNRDVVSIDAEADLRAAATLMCEEHVGALVVTSGEPPKAIGVVTDRDLAIEALGRPGDPRDLKVDHVASKPAVVVPGSASLGVAAALMEETGVRRLLVTDDDDAVIGVVSVDDVLAGIASELQRLSGAMRSGIAREKSQRQVITVPSGGYAGAGALGIA